VGLDGRLLFETDLLFDGGSVGFFNLMSGLCLRRDGKLPEVIVSPCTRRRKNHLLRIVLPFLLTQQIVIVFFFGGLVGKRRAE
jgi:hypothetical protein